MYVYSEFALLDLFLDIGDIFGTNFAQAVTHSV